MPTHKLIKLSQGDYIKLFAINKLGHMEKLAKIGDYIQLPLGDYFFNHPDAITHILQTNPQNYQKQNTPYDQMLAILGPGVLTKDGEKWHQARQLLQPYFNQKNIENQLLLTAPLIEASIAQWQQQPLNIIPHLTKLLVNMMTHILCGTNMSDIDTQLLPLIQKCNQEIAKVGPFYRPIKKRQHLQQSLNKLDQLLLNITPQLSDTNNALLTPLITLFQQKQITSFEYVSEMKNFFIAGTETTSSTLAWLIYNISSNQEIKAKVSNEIRQAYSSTKQINCNNLKQLTYTQMCIEETIRMYPPIWTILRKSTAKDKMHNLTIAPRKIIMLSPYTLHRHPDYWDNPNTFMPEHFLPKYKQQRPKGCYIPYGIGPRICIGKHLSQLIIKFILAHIFTNAEISLQYKHHPRVRTLVTLQPKNKIIAQLHSY